MSASRRRDLEHGTIPGLLRDMAQAHPDRPALEDGATTLSTAELHQRATEAARGLLALGLNPGDRVAIWAPNTWEWVVCALAIHQVGCVLVPINTRYRGVEAAYILNKSKARLLVTLSGFLDTDYPALLAAAGQPTPSLQHTVLLRGTPTGTSLSWADLHDRGAAVPPADVTARVSALAPDALSDILFTSGTTGQPKGVMATHAQSLRAYGDWADVVGLRSGDRYLVVAPFFHCFGYKAGWLACLLSGATIVPQPVFDVDAVLARIATDRISMLPGPPALYQTILARPDLADFDLSTLRLAVTGAASIPVQLIRDMRDILRFETVITGYGLTEACGIATMCRFDDDPETIATTSGRAIPDVEVRVVDPAGAELPRGEPGEVVIRGYNVMAGYFDAEDATAATIDQDGWLHTGDVGVMDPRGYLAITDRLKDMFIVGGFNAYPAEIEQLLLTHPDVAQVAVIGVPDERMGEVGMAFVIRHPGAELTAETLMSWSRQAMANFKVPRRVTFVDDLPRNASGKVLKTELRSRA